VANPTYSAPPPHQPQARPGTVTLSSYLLWAAAAVSLIGGILTLTTVGKMSEALSDLFAGGSAAGTESIIVGAAVAGVVVNILVAAGFVILSIFNNRGRNGARITTWVLGGLMLCCSGFGLAGTALTSGMNTGSAGGPSQEEIDSRLDAVLPSWYEPLSMILTVITLLSILGAVILLALPASNAFFRKPAAGGFDPSLPYPAYPGQQPQYPGQQPSGQPQYPTYPTTQQPGQSPYPQSGPPGAQSGPPPAYPQSGPPAQQPPQPPPSSDPWGRPEGEQKPPSDPTSQP
jgi:hypothetical protein